MQSIKHPLLLGCFFIGSSTIDHFLILCSFHQKEHVGLFIHVFLWLLFYNEAIDPEETEILSMILQPFVENALIDGLLPK